jgi:superoxide dismutase, Fe-Mn family
MNTAPMLPTMALALHANFGSVALWQAAFDALPGARLVFVPASGALQNIAALKDLPAAAEVLHAGPTAPDWAVVYERYQAAVHAATQGCAAGQKDLRDAHVLDVRRAGMFAQASTMIPGATWYDPALVGQWSQDLPRDKAVVVYCIYGHEVGRATALRLRAAGIDARFLSGGIDAWVSAGLPLQAKTDAP